MKGKVKNTVVRGRVIMENGVVDCELGWGSTSSTTEQAMKITDVKIRTLVGIDDKPGMIYDNKKVVRVAPTDIHLGYRKKKGHISVTHVPQPDGTFRITQSFLYIETDEGISLEEMRGLALKYVIPNSELDYAIGPAAEVDPARCKGCGTCARIAFCRAIEIQGRTAVVDSGKCECCGLCASLCPAGAISF